MDMTKRYFITSIHFSFGYDLSMREESDGIFIDLTTSQRYRKRLLYDCGWGQEEGYEMLPPLPFSNLIFLIESYSRQKEKQSCEKSNIDESTINHIRFCNMLGAVSVIMQDHVGEFIDFLSEKINTDFFNDPRTRENFKWFSFSTVKTRDEGKIPGGILTQSYEDIFNKNSKWEKISLKVIELVYQ